MTEAWKQEEYKELQSKLEAEEALRQTQAAFLEPEEIKGEGPSVGMQMLARSVGATLHSTEALVLKSEPQLSFARQDHLEQDGCDMIKAAYVFLEILGCPADARDFVICLMGISRGNSKEYLIITDAQIAAHMGYKDRHIVKRKREALIAWEQKNDYSIVRFKEREYNRETKRYKPSEYQLLIVDFVADFVRLARKDYSWQKNPRFAIENSVENGLQRAAQQVSQNIPNAEIVRRKKEERIGYKSAANPAPKSSEKVTDTFTPTDSNLIRFFDGWCRSHKDNLRAELERMQTILNEIALRYLEPE